MKDILFDAWNIALNPGVSSPDDFFDYMEKVNEIADMGEHLPIPIVLSRNAIGLMIEAGVYPIAWNDVSMSAYLGDISKAVGGFLKRVSYVEDGGVEDILFENFSSLPAIFDGSCEYRSEYLYKLVSLAYVNGRHPSCLVSSALSGNANSSAISFDLQCWDCRDGVDFVLGEGGHFFELQLSPAIKDAILGREAEIAKFCGINSAMVCSNFVRNGAVIDSLTDVNWSLGGRFVRSVDTAGVFSNSSKLAALVRACVNVINRNNERNVHPLRISFGGNSPQIVRDRDKAKAWRVDVDDDIHVHYWTIGDKFEFSKVVHHNDFEIFID